MRINVFSLCALVACGGKLASGGALSPDASDDVETKTDASDDALADAATPWVVLASNQSLPTSIAVDQTSVYWTDGHSGLVMKCAIDGCNDAPTVLASSQGAGLGIAVDALNVYWTTNPGDDTPPAIMKCAVSGCAGTPTAIAYSAGSSIATDGTNVYWTDNKLGRVLKCSPDCGNAPVILANNQNGPDSLVVHATSLYWANLGDGMVMSCDVGGCGGSPTVIASGGAGAIAVNTSEIFWETSSYIVHCPLSGCSASPAKFAPYFNSGEPTGIAADDTNVYWTDWSHDKVERCSVSGCNEPTVIATSQSEPAAITLNATDVFWTDEADTSMNPTTGTVVKLAK